MAEKVLVPLAIGAVLLTSIGVAASIHSRESSRPKKSRYEPIIPEIVDPDAGEIAHAQSKNNNNTSGKSAKSVNQTLKSMMKRIVENTTPNVIVQERDKIQRLRAITPGNAQNELLTFETVLEYMHIFTGILKNNKWSTIQQGQQFQILNMYMTTLYEHIDQIQNSTFKERMTNVVEEIIRKSSPNAAIFFRPRRKKRRSKRVNR